MSPVRRPRRQYTPSPLSDGLWQDRAACRGEATSLFYPSGGNRSTQAKRVCATCPVRQSCLEHALAVGERFGVWGGLTEDERRALRRRRGAA